MSQGTDGAPKRSVLQRLQRWLRDSLIAGLVATVPLIVVWWVLDKLVLSRDGVLGLIPEDYRNRTWSPPWLDAPIRVLDTPGMGFLVSLLLIVFVGALARGVLGRRIVARITRWVQQVPVLGTLYSAVRQLLESVFSTRAQNFQRVVMVEFPRKGAYCLGFLTARAWPGADAAVGKSLLSVFVPTTPNPTSGFFVMFAEEEVIFLEMTVEEAFKAIMSSGIVLPEDGGVMENPDLAAMTFHDGMEGA